MAATYNVREAATLHTRELPGEFRSWQAESAAIIADDDKRRRWEAQQDTLALRLSEDMVTHDQRRTMIDTVMSATQVQDWEWCRAVLEEHAWDAERSIAAMFGDVEVAMAAEEPRRIGHATAEKYYAGESYTVSKVALFQKFTPHLH